MSVAELSQFMVQVSGEPGSVWRLHDVRHLASLTPPGVLLSRHGPVIRADAYAVWFRWFVEGLCNPLRYVEDESKTIVDITKDALTRVDEIFPLEPKDEREALAVEVATRIMAEVKRRRLLARTYASSSEKQQMIDDAGSTPRCWLCGYAFGEKAIARFLRRSRDPVVLPDFVDVLRPRGVFEADTQIQVEHKAPVASGGGGADNLALSCGWCNRHKGARTSLYDADARAPRANYVLGGQQWSELPHPFWTVRIIAMRGRCEYVGGCAETVATTELFIAPSSALGSPNPSNLHVYCGKHDPFSADRIIGRVRAQGIWEERRRARG